MMISKLPYAAICISFLFQEATAAEKPQILFGVSPDEKGELADFSRFGVPEKDTAKVRFGTPLNFEIDSLKIWTFEGDGPRVTAYFVGIAGELKTKYHGPSVLMKINGAGYQGNIGNAGKGEDAIRGVDELLLESGQDYITFMVLNKVEAIAVANELAKILK